MNDCHEVLGGWEVVSGIGGDAGGWGGCGRVRGMRCERGAGGCEWFVAGVIGCVIGI